MAILELVKYIDVDSLGTEGEYSIQEISDLLEISKTKIRNFMEDITVMTHNQNGTLTIKKLSQGKSFRNFTVPKAVLQQCFKDGAIVNGYMGNNGRIMGHDQELGAEGRFTIFGAIDGIEIAKTGLSLEDFKKKLFDLPYIRVVALNVDGDGFYFWTTKLLRRRAIEDHKICANVIFDIIELSMGCKCDYTFNNIYMGQFITSDSGVMIKPKTEDDDDEVFEIYDPENLLKSS
jgi:hypothetical protein